MTDKCRNKKMFYLNNQSAIKSMPDDIVMSAYQYAKINNMNNDFTLLFASELQKRGLLD